MQHVSCNPRPFLFKTTEKALSAMSQLYPNSTNPVIYKPSQDQWHTQLLYYQTILNIDGQLVPPNFGRPCPSLIPLEQTRQKTYLSPKVQNVNAHLAVKLALLSSWTLTGAYLVTMGTSLPKFFGHLFFLAEEPVGLPSPLQSEQTDCICWTIPGASCLIIILMPRPRQAAHFWTAPDLPPWLDPWREREERKQRDL